MKKIVPIFVLTFLVSFNIQAQKRNFEWATTLGTQNPLSLNATALLLDNNNNSYVFGRHGTKTNYKYKVGELVFAKFDEKGKYIWFKTFTYPDQTFAGSNPYNIYWDTDSNIVVIGKMNAIFGNDTLHYYTSKLSPTIGIVKFDRLGNYIKSTQVDAAAGWGSVQLDDGSFCINGYGQVTWKKGSVINTFKEDFMVYIDKKLNVISGYKAPYPSYLNGAPSKIVRSGNNVIVFYNRLGMEYKKINPVNGNVVVEKSFRYDNMAKPGNYEYDSINQVVYFITRSNKVGDPDIVFHNDTFKATTNDKILIMFDLKTEKITKRIMFSNGSFLYTKFTYPNNFSYLINFLDSCTNVTTNEKHTILPYKLSNGKRFGHNYLIVNNDRNLNRNYYSHYATPTGPGRMDMYSLQIDRKNSIYALLTTNKETYFGDKKVGNNGHSFFFKTPKDTSQSTGAIISLEENNIRIYPNPAQHTISIDWNSSVSPISIEILSTNGVLIKQIVSIKSGIKVGDLSRGFYLVRIWDRNGRFVIKKLVLN